MGIFDKYRKAKPDLQEYKVNMRADNGDEVSFVTMGVTEVPTIREERNKDYVSCGLDNLYPEQLKELMNGSAIHNSIVIGKSAMMAGDGLLINGANNKEQSKDNYSKLAPDVKIKFDKFIKNGNNSEDWSEIIRKISYDYSYLGWFCLEIIWNDNFTETTTKYVDASKVRTGKLVNGKIEKYLYSRDWSKLKEYPFIEIPAFNVNDKKNKNQLLFVKYGNLEYYGETQYRGAMKWINVDSNMATFHLSNIENGFSPSLVFKFYKKPESEEKKQFILQNLKRQLKGAIRAGRELVFFSDGKDLAPDVEPVNASNLDKQYLALAELADKKIITGHRVTSPLLFGISTAGQLGANTELETAYRIYDNSVIDYDRQILESMLNKLLQLNNIPVIVEINPFNPLEDRTVLPDKGNAVILSLNSLSPLVATKVLENMSSTEIRALIGLAPNQEITQPVTTNPIMNEILINELNKQDKNKNDKNVHI